MFSSSINYDANNEAARVFFTSVQNKLHYVAHGHTVAEIVYERADANKPNLGMTNFIDTRPTRSEAAIAKYYLDEQELKLLNHLTTLYLDFAELRAIKNDSMTMTDWQTKLDEFIQVTQMALLTNKGQISHDVALIKAQNEYQNYINKVSDHDLRALENLLI